jgi:phage shock protein PspC (stress-responsive transcriptional regulator)
MDRWLVRLLWIIGVAVATPLIIVWLLEWHQRSEYMKWNISHAVDK